MPLAPQVPGVDMDQFLGKGAFGEVYRGRHRTLDVPVAVKIISSEGAETEALEQGLREARRLARLDHPNVVRIFDAGQLTPSSLYLVLELMDSGSLSGVHKMSEERLRPLTAQLLSGLQALHDAGFVHRDIKPANCLTRASDGRVKLADLGISAELRTTRRSHQDLAGTLPFMAPELFAQRPQFGVKSDLYALGITLACLAMRADPFPGGSVAEIVTWATQRNEALLGQSGLELDPVLGDLIDRLSSPRPQDRPADATEALRILLETACAQPPEGEPASQPVSAIGPWIVGEQVYASANWKQYVVTHRSTGRAAHLSQLQPGGPASLDNQFVLKAAERASTLEHTGILPVLDWGVRDGLGYVVTAPRGHSLREIVKSGGPLEEPEALRLCLSLAEALVYLHDRGLVYQMVDPETCVIAADAQSAQLAWPMYCIPAGTPAVAADGKSNRCLDLRYCPPEALGGGHRFMHEPILPSGDLYGLGLTLYYLLAGQLPYTEEARDALAWMGVKLYGARELASLAPDVTQPTLGLVRQLISPNPADRLGDAAQARDELARLVRRLGGD